MSEMREKMSLSTSSLDNTVMDFVTVVSVGSEAMRNGRNDQNESNSKKNETDQNSGYVTVLKIGDDNNTPTEITEEVLVYRLPGERLGFGLKFEGGTKAAEFVNRLFIQSCAPDSPASMVHCSWGKLTEGDEVLKIDSLLVTSMTRIDCVRCLKDSNVVIKLLVRHFFNKNSDNAVDGVNSSARLTEDLPHVIGAEKKRTPPPPPPVPPRKIPRKLLKDCNLIPNNNANTPIDTDVVPQTTEHVSNGTRCNRFQSPRNSGKFLRKSPEASRHIYKDRRLSDGSVGPPDAEVYLDLFSHEPGCNLSESDDTGSSISTIIDRLSSFPTTTNSSFAGSLPSTPTSIQKHLDMSNILSPFDKNELDAISNDNYWYSQLTSSQNSIEDNDAFLSFKNDDNNFEKPNKESAVVNDDLNPLQPPTNFQDAPLSYGNEDMIVPETYVRSSVNNSNYQERLLEIEDENGNCIKDLNCDDKVESQFSNTTQKLLVSSSGDHTTLECTIGSDVSSDTEYLNALDLPRLVYFTPKFNTNVDSKDQGNDETACTTIESVRIFLENEIRTSGFAEYHLDGSINDILESSESDMYNTEMYNLSWNLSSQLDTIGEDDEEGSQETVPLKSSTPIVIIENADQDLENSRSEQSLERIDVPDGAGTTSVDDGDNYKKEQYKSIEINGVILNVSPNDFGEIMDVPPSSSRQPPDGDEFPDCHEVTTISNDSRREPSSKTTSNWSHKLWNTNPCYNLFRDQQSSCSVRDKIAIFSNSNTSQSRLSNFRKPNKSTDDIPTTIENEKFEKNQCNKSKNSLNKVKRSLSTSCKSENDHWFSDRENIAISLKFGNLSNDKSRSSLDLTVATSHSQYLSEQKFDDAINTYTSVPHLHTRSQSLMDISSTDKSQKKDRWKLLAEQRQRSLSKLKGLIIPERVVEVDVPAVLDLPEIKSSSFPTALSDSKTVIPTETPNSSCQRNPHVPLLSSPPWTGNHISNVPKYSPAFKRKSLQIHSESHSKFNNNPTTPQYKTTHYTEYESDTVSTILDRNKHTSKQTPQIDLYHSNSKMASNLLNDAPKSLESITSPTRSDYSFEYVSSSPDIKEVKQLSSSKSYRLDITYREKVEVRKSEDDSDTDSAVSSSQSSYMSRTSPPASPSQLLNNFTSSSNGVESMLQLKDDESSFPLPSDLGDNQNHRLLKPQSVEAINRKNILASAKCRSGRDLKIGSPLIQRRFEEDKAKNAPYTTTNATSETKVALSERLVNQDNKTDVLNSNEIVLETDEPDKTCVISKDEFQNNCILTPQNIHSKSTSEQTKMKNGESKFVIGLNTPLRNNGNVIKKNMEKEYEAKRVIAHNNSPPKTARPASVNDLRKSFEKMNPLPINSDLGNTNLNKTNISVIEETPKQKNNRSNTDSVTKRHQILTKSTAKIEESITANETIVLRPEIPGGSVGITLAGGADYETKEITVHKIRGDSSAHRDGRLQKGDVVLFINGKSVIGLTHKQLVTLLKEPVPEVTLVVSKVRNAGVTSAVTTSPRKHIQTPIKKEVVANTEKQQTVVVSFMKDVSGLGLSLEGGHDSPLGNMPLLIKKVFKGGAAEKTGKLLVGDEILFVNETDVSSMSRFEAWSILKKLPENITISLTIRRSNMP